MIFTSRWAAISLAILLSSTAIRPLRAEIYEWVDDQNDRHFANSLDGIPSDKRANAKVVIGASTGSESDATVAVANPQTPAQRPANESEETDTQRLEERWQAGFDAGWNAAQRAAAAEQPICPAEPTVVVLDSRPPVTLNVPRTDPSGAYYQPPPVNPVAGPFDDGTSMGLTFRERVQDLRALERGW